MRIRFVLAALLAGLALFFVVAFPGPPLASAAVAAAPVPRGAERLLQLVNRDRVVRGTPALVRRDDLDTIAASWNDRLAAQGGLRHNEEYFSPGMALRLGAGKLGENVAFDVSPESAHRHLMESPPHRANILDPEFGSVGIAVAQAGDGSLYLTEDFLAGAPAGRRALPRSTRPPRTPARSGRRVRRNVGAGFYPVAGNWTKPGCGLPLTCVKSPPT
jgi:hypothetical protein